MDAHKQPDEETMEDMEYDKEFKKIYKGTSKRSMDFFIHISHTKYFHAIVTFSAIN